MDTKQHTYISIDLKSFYASVECRQRGYDPLTTNLVVADESRTEKTICLAVSPSLKAYGISGRARLFEVIQQVDAVNRERLRKSPAHQFTGKSFHDPEVREDPNLALDFCIAVPQMARYMEVSTQIYEIYLKYISPEDIHVYSIDEVFIDATNYLKTYRMTAEELAMQMIHDVLLETGITATAGIGSNLFLSKIAMDIMAKKMPANQDGVRIAQLDTISYRQKLWDHTPLTAFWRIGPGIARKLEAMGLKTMGDIAQYSLSPSGRNILFKLFGVNAELIIDHAWGYEPCSMRAIKEYGARRKSLGSGQVLSCAYEYEKAKLVVQEMADALSLDLKSKQLVTDQIVLTVGYDRASLEGAGAASCYRGKIAADHYGRKVPAPAHGSTSLSRPTASTKLIVKASVELFCQLVNPDLLVRRLNITAGRVMPETEVPAAGFNQLDFFSALDAQASDIEAQEEIFERERRRQQAILNIRRKYGKNALVKGMNQLEGATMIQRNGQVGGHKA